jgi:hypothetical protein
MTARPVPSRHRRTYGNNYPLPTGAEALQQPLSAFPSWFLRITCDRCGKDRTIVEMARGDARCSTRSGASGSRPVRRIVLREG